MKEWIKNLGHMAGFWALFIAALFLFVLVIHFGLGIAFTILPILFNIFGIALTISILIVLPLAIFRKTRGFSSVTLYIVSYIFGFIIWVAGFAITYQTLGTFGLIFGLLLGLIGVVPLGIIGSAIHADWGNAISLLIGLALIYGVRIIALKLAESLEIREIE